MVTLLSFVIDSPPGPIQLIITELNSTPLTVLTIHWISCGLPTIAPCMGPDGNVAASTLGTMCFNKVKINQCDYDKQCHAKYLPVTFNVKLSAAVVGDIVLIIISHIKVLASSKVLNCVMVKFFVYITESLVVEVSLSPSILSSSEPLLLHTISTLLVIPLTVVIVLSSVSDLPTTCS